MDRPAIVWFRDFDLRLDDQAGLAAAIATGAPIWPIFIYDDKIAIGGAARWWLHYALADLDSQLREHGVCLTILRGDTLRLLLELAGKSCGVFYGRAHTPAGCVVESNFGEGFHGFETSLLFSPELLKPSQVFKPFYNRARVLDLPAPHSAPRGPWKGFRAPRHPAQVLLDALELLPKLGWDKGLHDAWGTPSCADASAQLKKFARTQSDYKSRRDFPAIAGTSRLSPYLRFGQISPRRVAAVVDRDGEFFRQLVWREFCASLLLKYPQTLTEPLREKYRDFPWQPNPAHLKAWQEGRTGYPLVDAGMRQLWESGWMHNRVRMLVASFLVKHLLQDWRAGAAWFMDTLVDADEANNTFGWQWAAGCGADAAPYFRIFNPTLQQQKFDPDFAYIKRWVPEFGSPDYPAPIVDHKTARDRALAALHSL